MVPTLQFFRRLHKSLLKDHDYQRAAMLVNIVVGACWPECRLHDSGYAFNGLCPRCADEKEDMQHRCWKCHSNGFLQNTACSTDVGNVTAM
eukprot:5612986-Pyramimonas_sp.AAC.1